MAYPQSDSFDLQQLDLTRGDQTFDISAIFLGISLSEDIDTPFISGSIVIRDTENFIEQMQPDGTETLKIKFRTGRPGKADKTPVYIEHEFRVKAVRAAEKTKPGETLYILDIISEDFILNMTKKISRAFVQVDPAGTIQNLLKSELDSEEVLIADGSFDHVSYIAPFSNPFEIVNHFARITRKNGQSDVLFFRNNRGYVLESLQTLIDDNKAQHEFFETPEGTPAARNHAYLNSVEDVYPVDVIRQDLLDAFRAGRDGISMQSYDRNTKTFSYASEPVPVHSTAHDSSTNLLPSGLQSRRLALRTAFAVPVIFLMGGHTGRAVGDMIIFRRPTGGKVKEFQWSNLYSGRYIITKIDHAIDRTIYNNTIEAIRVGDA